MRRFALLITTALLAFLIVVFWRLSTAYPANGALVGSSESAVRSQLGLPASEFAGHYGLTPAEFAKSFAGEMKTSTFAVSGGTEYVSFERRTGGSVAICNDWLPVGGTF